MRFLATFWQPPLPVFWIFFSLFFFVFFLEKIFAFPWKNNSEILKTADLLSGLIVTLLQLPLLYPYIKRILERGKSGPSACRFFFGNKLHKKFTFVLTRIVFFFGFFFSFFCFTSKKPWSFWQGSIFYFFWKNFFHKTANTKKTKKVPKKSVFLKIFLFYFKKPWSFWQGSIFFVVNFFIFFIFFEKTFFKKYKKSSKKKCFFENFSCKKF